MYYFLKVSAVDNFHEGPFSMGTMVCLGSSLITLLLDNLVIFLIVHKVVFTSRASDTSQISYIKNDINRTDLKIE